MLPIYLLKIEANSDNSNTLLFGVFKQFPPIRNRIFRYVEGHPLILVPIIQAS